MPISAGAVLAAVAVAVYLHPLLTSFPHPYSSLTATPSDPQSLARFPPFPPDLSGPFAPNELLAQHATRLFEGRVVGAESPRLLAGRLGRRLAAHPLGVTVGHQRIPGLVAHLLAPRPCAGVAGRGLASPSASAPPGHLWFTGGQGGRTRVGGEVAGLPNG